MARTDSTTSRSRPIDEARIRLAQVVEVAGLVVALILVVAAALVAFRGSINGDNTLVDFVLTSASAFDGPLSRRDGVFTFSGDSAVTRNALANWGVAAALYLLVGRILGRIVKP